MRESFNLYRRFVGIQIRSQLQYRVSFLMDVLASASITGLWFVSLALLLQRFEGVGGWKIGEIAFLYGMVEIGFGTMDMIFSGFDPDRFSQYIRRGTFDQLLLRPIDLSLQVLGADFVLRRLGRILEGMIVFVVALTMTDIHWTVAKVMLLPLMFVGIVCFFGGLFVIGATLTFWTVQSMEAVNIFTYGGSELISYPMHIYQDWLRRLFTYVIPSIFLNYAPAIYILDKPNPLHLPSFSPLLSPVVGVGTLYVASLFWRFGVRHYQSTGS